MNPHFFTAPFRRLQPFQASPDTMYIMYHLFSLLSNLLCSNFKFHPLSNHRIQKIPLLKVMEIKVFRQLLQIL